MLVGLGTVLERVGFPVTIDHFIYAGNCQRKEK